MTIERRDEKCESCGAARCVEIFDRCLASEFSDPEFFAVHHLTVPAYGLQHGHYEPTVEAAVARMIIEHIAAPPSPAATSSLRSRFGGQSRVRRRSGSPAEPSAPVSMAAVQFATAAQYQASVRLWAESVARSVLS